MTHFRIFLSAVSNEFGCYRQRLAEVLKRPNVSVHVQEDFIATGSETLDKLDDYIRHCDVVIHLVGDMTGDVAGPSSVTALLMRYPDLPERLPVLSETIGTGSHQLSYTQWEAFIALYHKRMLIIAEADECAPRDKDYCRDNEQVAGQREHLVRLEACKRYSEIKFLNVDDLAIGILRSKLLDVFRAEEKSVLQIAGAWNAFYIEDDREREPYVSEELVLISQDTSALSGEYFSKTYARRSRFLLTGEVNGSMVSGRYFIPGRKDSAGIGFFQLLAGRATALGPDGLPRPDWLEGFCMWHDSDSDRIECSKNIWVRNDAVYENYLIEGAQKIMEKEKILFLSRGNK